MRAMRAKPYRSPSPYAYGGVCGAAHQRLDLEGARLDRLRAAVGHAILRGSGLGGAPSAVRISGQIESAWPSKECRWSHGTEPYPPRWKH